MTKFHYDKQAAERAVNFFPECLVHVKGERAGRPLELHPAYAQIVRDLFGWKRKDGTRKYRKAYVEIPRKNAKSTIAAGIATYLLFDPWLDRDAAWSSPRVLTRRIFPPGSSSWRWCSPASRSSC